MAQDGETIQGDGDPTAAMTDPYDEITIPTEAEAGEWRARLATVFGVVAPNPEPPPWRIPFLLSCFYCDILPDCTITEAMQAGWQELYFTMNDPDGYWVGICPACWAEEAPTFGRSEAGQKEFDFTG